MQNFQIKTDAQAGDIKRTLTDLNQGFKEEEVVKKAQALGIGYVNLLGIKINPDLMSVISAEDSQKGQVVPFFKSGKKVRLAFVDPENRAMKEIVQNLKTENYQLNLNLCSEESLLSAQKVYATKKIKPKTDFELTLSEESVRNFEAQIADLAKIKEKLEEMQSDEILNFINAGAIQTNSSDVHIQPEEKEALLRFRIDGVLKNILRMPLVVYDALVKQIKYEAGLKFNLTYLPQDGQFFFRVNQFKIDVRVSTLPTEFGETVVMRYLDERKGIVELEKLGLQGTNLENFKKGINIPKGMILVTGPTGSGKTTTLYAILNQLNSSEKKIITLEDPIEYHLAGISQSQIHEEKGYDFALGLRAILRQDPDIVMVGEIRDQVTAETAAQAALTGHLVLSTLHTNSAIETIPRLVNMGLKSFILAPALNMIIAQRLVRRLCPHCKKKKVLSVTEKEYLKQKIAELNKRNFKINDIPNELFVSAGCERCSKTGFSGQIALMEILIISEQIEKMILAGTTTPEILAQASKSGMLTLEEDGIFKVLEGTTSLSEIKRVV